MSSQGKVTPEQFVLFSYVPLLRGAAGEMINVSVEDPSQMTALFKQHLANDAGYVEGCLWRVDTAGVSPVFVLKDMQKVVDHLVEWSEGEPQRWFHLYVYEAHDRYAVALVPNLELSVERFQLAAKLLHAVDIEPAQIRVLFKPIIFVSGPNAATFAQVKDRISGAVLVGFVDHTHMPTPDPKQVRNLARFDVRRDSCSGLLEQALQD